MGTFALPDLSEGEDGFAGLAGFELLCVELAFSGVAFGRPVAGLPGALERPGEAALGAEGAGRLGAAGRAGVALVAVAAPFFMDAPQNGHTSASSSRTD
jgi:hypothetical protein